MKKRVLSLILISALSLSLFVGCGDDNTNNNSQNSNQQEEQQPEKNNEDNNTDKEASAENNDKDTGANIVEEITDEKIEAKFTEVMEFLYNRDYSNEEKSMEAENYIKENFTPEGAKNMINKIISYGEKVSYSDLLITLVKNIENNDDRYESMYEIRYNVSITIGKPSIYSDVVAKVVVDKDGKIFIENINDFEF
ncbi:Uncharacterised protein [uncultured Clostridium sp.]|uniref:hypothetical protein n=1 Tax=uncultured Clostridium sp. TaxID=59620 RepID=UPI0008205B32|nr:hypothetical protein [uncultured Clostridium sp.]SCJ33837.1 Uncharacterised protein [uncultured Clostridium sp.]